MCHNFIFKSTGSIYTYADEPKFKNPRCPIEITELLYQGKYRHYTLKSKNRLEK